MRLDAEPQQDVAQIPEGQDKTDDVTVGQTVAVQILAFRSTDGPTVTPPPFVPGNQPGDYQLTPPISRRRTSHNGLRSLPSPWYARMNFVPDHRRI
jgi:hypothetical protein